MSQDDSLRSQGQPVESVTPALGGDARAAGTPDGVGTGPAAGAGFPPELEARIREIQSRYPEGTQAALIPVLHLAQRHWGGWLPDDAIRAVSTALGVAEAEVYGVVSFYDLFHQEPVGRHRIRVCTNLSCQLRGSGEIMETLHDLLGVAEDQITPDGRCSFTHFECLGSCDTAPMMMVDDTYHENLTPDDVKRIVEELD